VKAQNASGPNSMNSRWFALSIQARKAGDDVLAGVTAQRLFELKLAP
jgi:hypothetical protein